MHEVVTMKVKCVMVYTWSYDYACVCLIWSYSPHPSLFSLALPSHLFISTLLLIICSLLLYLTLYMFT